MNDDRTGKERKGRDGNEINRIVCALRVAQRGTRKTREIKVREIEI